jgi:hypothetical protein
MVELRVEAVEGVAQVLQLVVLAVKVRRVKLEFGAGNDT